MTLRFFPRLFLFLLFSVGYAFSADSAFLPIPAGQTAEEARLAAANAFTEGDRRLFATLGKCIGLTGRSATPHEEKELHGRDSIDDNEAPPQSESGFWLNRDDAHYFVMPSIGSTLYGLYHENADIKTLKECEQLSSIEPYDVHSRMIITDSEVLRRIDAIKTADVDFGSADPSRQKAELLQCQLNALVERKAYKEYYHPANPETTRYGAEYMEYYNSNMIHHLLLRQAER